MVPVVVWIVHVIPTLDVLYEAPELGWVKVVVAHQPRDLAEVVHKQGKCVAWSCLSKGKDIELPVVLCILQTGQAYTLRRPAS